jgi:aryl-alcohol dehydrogenase-like predicted oxidoreductase
VPREKAQTVLMIESLAFGSTGHQSSRLIFGAAALGRVSQEKADEILAEVVAGGINHLDSAASYGDSELRLAPFLATHRADVFLATKTGERDGSAARAELERSLARLGVDSVDLIQLHNLVEEDEWQQAFSSSGAVAALEQARREGLVSHIGVTGHGLRIARMHLRSLAEFAFASVLFPFNHSLLTIDAYRADVEELMDECVSRQVAMQTIKSVARGRWAPDVQRRFSWYEPLSDPDALGRAVRFVLSHPNLFLNTSSDARLLPRLIDIASTADATTRPGDAELETDRIAQAITPLFDGADLERI